MIHSLPFLSSFLPSINKHSLHTYHVPRPVVGSGDTYMTLSLWFRSQSIQGNKRITDQLKYIVTDGCKERHRPLVQEISETRVCVPVRIAEMRFWMNSSRKNVSPLSGDHAMRRSRTCLLKGHPSQKDYHCQLLLVREPSKAIQEDCNFTHFRKSQRREQKSLIPATWYLKARPRGHAPCQFHNSARVAGITCLTHPNLPSLRHPFFLSTAMWSFPAPLA